MDQAPIKTDTDIFNRFRKKSAQNAYGTNSIFNFAAQTFIKNSTGSAWSNTRKNWRPFREPWAEMTEPINHDDLRPESRGTSYIMLEKNLKWPSDGPLLMWIIDRLSGLLPPIWTWTLIFGCFILPCKRSLWLKTYFRVLHRSLRTPTFQLLRSLSSFILFRDFFREMQEWKIATMRIFRVSPFDWLPAMFFSSNIFLASSPPHC